MQNQNVNLTILNLNHCPLSTTVYYSLLLLPTTVYYTNVRGLMGSLTYLETFILKNNPDIIALCETNLHDNIQDSDFQLPGYLPIHRKNAAGHMHDLGVYAKINLPIARETILEDVFSLGASTFDYIFLVSFAIFVIYNINNAPILHSYYHGPW